MNNIQELELRVANAKKELEEVTRLLEESKKKTKKFVPEYDEGYCSIDGCGGFTYDIWTNHQIDNWRLLSNNCFRTREEAEEAKKKIEIQAEFERLAELSWGDEEIDWNDIRQCKHYIYYNYYFEKIIFNYGKTFKTQGVKHFKSEEKLKEAIDCLGKENILKYVLEV